MNRNEEFRISMVKDDYVKGRIEIEEFERIIGYILSDDGLDLWPQELLTRYAVTPFASHEIEMRLR